MSLSCFAENAACLSHCLAAEFGEAATYASRDGAAVAFSGVPSERNVQRASINNIDVEIITMKFTASKQTNFPPAPTTEGGGITIDDVVTINSVRYYITEARQDSARVSYVLSLENEEARRLRG